MSLFTKDIKDTDNSNKQFPATPSTGSNPGVSGLNTVKPSTPLLTAQTLPNAPLKTSTVNMIDSVRAMVKESITVPSYYKEMDNIKTLREVDKVDWSFICKFININYKLEKPVKPQLLSKQFNRHFKIKPSKRKTNKQ
jgi:hypothetical protein